MMLGRILKMKAQILKNAEFSMGNQDLQGNIDDSQGIREIDQPDRIEEVQNQSRTEEVRGGAPYSHPMLGSLAGTGGTSSSMLGNQSRTSPFPHLALSHQEDLIQNIDATTFTSPSLSIPQLKINPVPKPKSFPSPIIPNPGPNQPYFVTEPPDSPKSPSLSKPQSLTSPPRDCIEIQTLLPSQANPTNPSESSLSPMDLTLTSVFNSLCLKRKTLPDSVDHPNSKLLKIEGHSPHSKTSQPKTKTTISRNTRNTPSRTKKPNPQERKEIDIGDLNLIDVSVHQSNEMVTQPMEGRNDQGISQALVPTIKAPVAGLEQPRSQWLSCENDYPWFCVGDFNEIGSIWEKQGGGECPRSRIELFQSFLSDCALMDLEFKGPAYTWTNNQGEGFNIRERLDKALATVEWREIFPYAQVFHELMIGSDHSPIIVHCCIPPKRVPYVFKFESMWCTSENCKNIIANAWAVNCRGSAMFQLVQKLKNCRGALRPWSKMEFGNNVERIKALKENLALMQLHPFSQEQYDREKQLKEELEITMLREEMYLHQRSRINWDEEGHWFTEEADINGQLKVFFSTLFKSTGPRDFNDVLSNVKRCITLDMNCRLTRNVTNEEIKEAVFQLGSLKSLGPDGFPGVFYQSYWEVVGDDLCSAVKRFFEGGFLLKELNRTNLVLIPKVLAPESLAQFRPISLCNFNLKVITKVMANRLKGLLNGFVSVNQSAFVPGRMIQDSVIVAHEAFHFLKRKKTGKEEFMAIKLDFNKAYDRVEWDFLEAIMNQMGFDKRWVKWVMECVSTVQFDVCTNGESRAKVYPQRGLRQGDPLSPYLFLLVKDVLSGLIQKELDQGNLSGLRINRLCPVLSHIFFADDALLFAKAELRECNTLKTILHQYGAASGQSINLDKSSIVFSSNMCSMDKQLICFKVQSARPPNSNIQTVADVIDSGKGWNT
ncbi:hypothetical protein RHSIM_RhsimUnG0053200 [Rhododendron simsii]|uniref:Reverse transcriptase domain-containing protein n=1 Tax=Rhododendron simsii TaxID=118357 RepID=A0A834FVX4_RHOSS|nr:hypothetical protein RHSIM_RhsimUnG0053200 [Rhododendron simsii]